MKKVMFALAIAGMISFAACNNAANEEEVVDTVATEEVVEEVVAEEVVDTTAVEAVAEEAVATEEAAQ